VSSAIPCSKAAAKANVLKVEPAWAIAWVALFNGSVT
jgi:hypothetical protein